MHWESFESTPPRSRILLLLPLAVAAVAAVVLADPRPVDRFATGFTSDAPPGSPPGTRIWYPTPMRQDLAPTCARVAAYFPDAARMRDLQTAPSLAGASRRAELLAMDLMPPSSMSSWLAEELPLACGAPMAAGRFPVVLLSVGAEMPASALAELGEALGQEGVVVVSVPAPPDVVLASMPMSDAVARTAQPLVDAQAWVRRQPWADSGRVWIGGWSIGALAALAVVGAHPGDAAGLLSLDGGVGFAYADVLGDSLARRATSPLPVVHLWATRPGTRRVARSRATLELLPGSHVYLVSVPDVSHAEMVSAYGRDLPVVRPAGELERLCTAQSAIASVVHAVVMAPAQARAGSAALLPATMPGIVVERLAPR
jgi:dienelactone hydrolase